jgi:hypothetical protein
MVEGFTVSRGGGEKEGGEEDLQAEATYRVQGRGERKREEKKTYKRRALVSQSISVSRSTSALPAWQNHHANHPRPLNSAKLDTNQEDEIPSEGLEVPAMPPRPARMVAEA